MKIRIRDNSVRLRLARGEIDAMREKGVVRSLTCFPGGREFRYSLESSPTTVNPAAFYSDNEIKVKLPETAVLSWVTTEQVSIFGEQLLDDGTTLTILVEKDFACLTPREGEDDANTFPHPDSGKTEC